MKTSYFKKAVAFIFSCIILSGCVSDSEFRELEERVSALENQVGINELSSSELDESNTHNDDSQERDDSSFTYFIDSLSDSEVVEECEYYFYNIPDQGESFDTYYSCLKAVPVNTFEDNGVECQFYDNRIMNEPTDRDVITWIRILGTQSEMDGNIGYCMDYYGVTIGMIITDYDRAAYIYDALYNSIVNEYYFEIDDRRDSTTWDTSAMFLKGEGMGGFGVHPLEMTKANDGFHLIATYYVWR